MRFRKLPPGNEPVPLFWFFFGTFVCAGIIAAAIISIHIQRTDDESIPLKLIPQAATGEEHIDGVAYSVLKTGAMHGGRSIEVQLSRPLPENALRRLSKRLRERQAAQYDRVFIGYYLQYMHRGLGFWAVAYFDPELRLSVLGLAPGMREQIAARSPVGQGVIGQWIDEYRSPGTVYQLLLLQGTTMMEVAQPGEKETYFTVQELKVQDGRKFVRTVDDGQRQSWVIDAEGNLLCHDRHGLYATLHKL